MRDPIIRIRVEGGLPGGPPLAGWALSTGLPCPACFDGRLVWAEAGHVPGYRICSHCGRGWLARPTRDGLALYIPETTEGLEWEPPERWTIRWSEDPRGGYDPEQAHAWGVHGGPPLHRAEECPDRAEEAR